VVGRLRVEIDAVALAGRSRRPVLAGEAKWASRLDAGRAVRTLCAKTAALPGASPERMQLALCARDGPSDLLTVTPDDILPLP